uniref:Coagulation factor XIII B chain n=1 Tax=Sphenodon punctatus TaxID=8508 RepID=A0A8D0HRF9_SPHPU
RVAQYYYSFKSYYFPMSKDKKLSYSCLAGYTTESGSQEARITCTARGWSPAPQCYKKCSKPLLANGFFSNTKMSYKVWEKLEYRCASGYQTSEGEGEETVQCIPEGWSSQPNCAKKFEACLAPGLHHGHYVTTQRVFRLNERVRYECDEGYRTTGGNATEETECRSQGWSSTPNCTKFACTLLSSVEHGGFHPKKKSYEVGDVVQFFCLENYSLNGSELIQCYDFGWSPQPPVCEDRRKKCPSPPQPPNAKIPRDLRIYGNGDKMHLECQANFKLRGAEEIRCENGKWTSPPNCIGQWPYKIGEHIVPCGNNMYTCTYSCLFLTDKMADAAILDLENNGSCSPPPALENGIILSSSLTSYAAGSSVEYVCHRYHLLEGPGTVHCKQGIWTAQPICLEPCILDANEMSHNNIEMKWRLEGELYFLHGDTVGFVCKQGYVLPPSTRESHLMAQCTRGQLKYPKCVVKDPNENCGSPPLIENGSVIDSVLTEYDHGLSVEYSCSDHHFLQGSRMVHCLKGQWTTPPICIEPCTLSKDEMDNNNLILRWSYDNKQYFFHGEYVEFLCKPNHFRVPPTSEFDFRVQCHGGQLAYPRCSERRR